MRTNSSRPQSPAEAPGKSLENAGKLFTPDQASLFSGDGPPEPGSLNDDRAIRAIITESVRSSNKSREQVAEEMTRLTGDKVTVRMLNSYTSDASEQHRWPSQYTRAFCYVVDNWALLRCIVERSGFHMITSAERELLSLGREYLRQKRAAERIQLLEKRLGGFEL